MSTFIKAFLLVSLAFCGHDCYEHFPFRNVSLPFNERVKDIVGRLTLEEIVKQMSHGGAQVNGPAPAIARLGISPYQWGTECLSGDVIAGNATSFPMPIGMAASFNRDLVHEVASVIGDEVRAKNNDAVSKGIYIFHSGLSCWSPVLNILRDPRWGRNQETYGEDPWLSGHLGYAYVTGLQGSCKHFDVHGGPENIPVSRFSFDSKVSTKDWRMTFLPQFKRCVEAGSWSLMCSYNSINGIPACANEKLLTDILRSEWGFQGYVVSDQGALENIVSAHKYSKDKTHAAASAVNAGTDLEDGNLPIKLFNTFANLGNAVNQNLTDISTLKKSVSRLFMVRMKLGEFDPPELNPYKKLNISIIQNEEHRLLSLKAALQSMVLLKNTRQGGLPLNYTVDNACVVGPFADDEKYLFGDYAPSLMPHYCSTPLSGIRNNAKIGLKSLNTAKGCEDGPSCKLYSQRTIHKACKDSEVAIVTLGLSHLLEAEGNDRPNIDFPGHQLDLLKDVAASGNASIILVLFNACPLDISWAKHSPRVKAIIEAYYPAQSTGDALAQILTGAYNPGSRLPNTWPASVQQVPDITNYTMNNRTYRYFEGVPLYPFGYGLSYTIFRYSRLMLTPKVIKAGDNVSVTASVENTGGMNGDEVTQLYIVWANNTIPDLPQRQLVGIHRTTINKGTTAKLHFIISAQNMNIWNDGEWIIPTGDILVYVGGQQPQQHDTVPSNVLSDYFHVST